MWRWCEEIRIGEYMADSSVLIEIGVGVVGVLQGLNIFVTAGLKNDIKSLWNRANNHGHVIECNAKDCKPTTHAVILRGNGEG
jgi:hypothetical protein